MTKVKIKFLKPGYYNCNYPAGSIVEVDKAYADYQIGLQEAEFAKADDKITDPIPYVMPVRKTGSEDALQIIADALTKAVKPVPPSVSAKPVPTPPGRQTSG